MSEDNVAYTIKSGEQKMVEQVLKELEQKLSAVFNVRISVDELEVSGVPVSKIALMAECNGDEATNYYRVGVVTLRKNKAEVY